MAADRRGAAGSQVSSEPVSTRASTGGVACSSCLGLRAVTLTLNALISSRLPLAVPVGYRLDGRGLGPHDQRILAEHFELGPRTARRRCRRGTRGLSAPGPIVSSSQPLMAGVGGPFFRQFRGRGSSW